MPSSSEDAELEAMIWAAMKAHKVTTDDAVPFVDAIKTAARRYAAGDSEELTAMRREVLHRDTAPQAQTSPSDCGGDSRADAAELHPTGSAALVRRVAGGGATMSTGQPIPGPVTSGNLVISTCA